MTNIIRSFSGRDFTSEEIEQIIWVRKTYSKLSRTELCATVSEILNWTTPAGKAKIIPCREFLELLENEGVITLPPLRKIKERKEKTFLDDIEIDDAEIICTCGELKDIRLEVASAGESIRRWRWHIDKYHMLGDKIAFGAQIHYFVMAGTRELGCIQFSASAWALAERDNWIGWDVEDRKKRLHLIINNSRFLIFPWVKVKNLASHILSIVVKQIRQDWLNIYCYEPVLLETFVDTAHFAGTIYKASNWTHLGETQGRGRQDRYSEYKVSKKAILMYPLKGDFRKYLRGEKEYKKVVDE